ncbi:MAG: permease prefix domain 1-containing protein [Candidatus Acidiferrales bacterium]
MRDWQSLVRERLSGRGLTSAQQDEIVAELAAHLEDLYEEQRAQGANEPDAIRAALDEVADWRRLSRKIQNSKQKEGQMNARTKNMWLPGLATLTFAMGTLMVMGRFNIEPKPIYWRGSVAIVQLYLPWLAVLPLIGGLGAYLSRQAQGQLRARLIAALFPALAPFAIFCPAIVVSAVLEHHQTWSVVPIAFAVLVFNWVLIPGAALLLGASPFLRNSRIQDAQQASC